MYYVADRASSPFTMIYFYLRTKWQCAVCCEPCGSWKLRLCVYVHGANTNKFDADQNVLRHQLSAFTTCTPKFVTTSNKCQEIWSLLLVLPFSNIYIRFITHILTSLNSFFYYLFAYCNWADARWQRLHTCTQTWIREKHAVATCSLGNHLSIRL